MKASTPQTGHCEVQSQCDNSFGDFHNGGTFSIFKEVGWRSTVLAKAEASELQQSREMPRLCGAFLFCGAKEVEWDVGNGIGNNPRPRMSPGRNQKPAAGAAPGPCAERGAV